MSKLSDDYPVRQIVKDLPDDEFNDLLSNTLYEAAKRIGYRPVGYYNMTDDELDEYLTVSMDEYQKRHGQTIWGCYDNTKEMIEGALPGTIEQVASRLNISYFRTASKLNSFKHHTKKLVERKDGVYSWKGGELNPYAQYVDLFNYVPSKARQKAKPTKGCLSLSFGI